MRRLEIIVLTGCLWLLTFVVLLASEAYLLINGEEGEV